MNASSLPHDYGASIKIIFRFMTLFRQSIWFPILHLPNIQSDCIRAVITVIGLICAIKMEFPTETEKKTWTLWYYTRAKERESILLYILRTKAMPNEKLANKSNILVKLSEWFQMLSGCSLQRLSFVSNDENDCFVREREREEKKCDDEEKVVIFKNMAQSNIKQSEKNEHSNCERMWKNSEYFP